MRMLIKALWAWKGKYWAYLILFWYYLKLPALCNNPQCYNITTNLNPNAIHRAKSSHFRGFLINITSVLISSSFRKNGFELNHLALLYMVQSKNIKFFKMIEILIVAALLLIIVIIVIKTRKPPKSIAESSPPPKAPQAEVKIISLEKEASAVKT